MVLNFKLYVVIDGALEVMVVDCGPDLFVMTLYEQMCVYYVWL